MRWLIFWAIAISLTPIMSTGSPSQAALLKSKNKLNSASSPTSHKKQAKAKKAEIVVSKAEPEKTPTSFYGHNFDQPLKIVKLKDSGRTLENRRSSKKNHQKERALFLSKLLLINKVDDKNDRRRDGRGDHHHFRDESNSDRNQVEWFSCLSKEFGVNYILEYSMEPIPKIKRKTLKKSLSKEELEELTNCDEYLLDPAEQFTLMKDSELESSDSSAYEEYDDLLDN